MFRVDASVQIGSGHLMRCLTLADVLVLSGHQCQFICREHKGHLGALVKSRGHSLSLLSPPPKQDGRQTGGYIVDYSAWLGVSWQEDAEQTIGSLSSMPDLLVVDHYALDFRWEVQLSSAVKSIFVIDDLANRAHECTFLLDQNLGRTARDYRGLVSADSKLLIGPRFALLRPEFALLRDKSLARRQSGEIKRILIFFGGVDLLNFTGQVLEAIAGLVHEQELEVDIVMGASAPNIQNVIDQAGRQPFHTTVSVNVSNMAERMCLADLSIGAVGSTSWERCSLGLPSLLMVLADNQKAVAEALMEAGAAIVVNNVCQIIDELKRLIDGGAGSGTLIEMAKASSILVQGNGCAETLKMITRDEI